MDIELRKQAALAQDMNFILDMMDASTGIPSGYRYKVPTPVVHTGNMTNNNIKLDGSVVGTINTGNIQSLEQSMNNIENSGNAESAKVLSAFVQAVVDSKDLEPKAKEEVLENLAFVGEQTALPSEQRKSSMSRSAMESIKSKVSTVANLATLWQVVAPALEAFLNS